VGERHRLLVVHGQDRCRRRRVGRVQRGGNGVPEGRTHDQVRVGLVSRMMASASEVLVPQAGVSLVGFAEDFEQTESGAARRAPRSCFPEGQELALCHGVFAMD